MVAYVWLGLQSVVSGPWSQTPRRVGEGKSRHSHKVRSGRPPQPSSLVPRHLAATDPPPLSHSRAWSLDTSAHPGPSHPPPLAPKGLSHPESTGHLPAVVLQQAELALQGLLQSGVREPTPPPHSQQLQGQVWKGQVKVRQFAGLRLGVLRGDLRPLSLQPADRVQRPGALGSLGLPGHGQSPRQAAPMKILQLLASPEPRFLSW